MDRGDTDMVVRKAKIFIRDTHNIRCNGEWYVIGAFSIEEAMRVAEKIKASDDHTMVRIEF
jgi:hypothetical protein